MQAISIKQILEIMKSGQSFSLTCVKYDRTRKKGGGLLEVHEAVLFRENAKKQEDRSPTKMEAIARKIQKKPSHGKWYTRNIRVLADGHPTGIIHKIHPPLIIKFNGLNVVP